MKKASLAEKILVLCVVLAGLILSVILIAIGAEQENNNLFYRGIILALYSVIFGAHWYIIEKYHAPKTLLWLAIANYHGLIVLLILVFRPNGYAARARMVSCPNCGGLIDPGFTICPYCRRETRRATAPSFVYAQPDSRSNGGICFCTNCGTRNEGNAFFCKDCGSRL